MKKSKLRTNQRISHAGLTPCFLHLWQPFLALCVKTVTHVHAFLLDLNGGVRYCSKKKKKDEEN